MQWGINLLSEYAGAAYGLPRRRDIMTTMGNIRFRQSDIDRITHNVIQTVTERAEKAEAEFADLREKVAWYFECLENWPTSDGVYSNKLNAADDHGDILGHAEQELRDVSRIRNNNELAL